MRIWQKVLCLKKKGKFWKHKDSLYRESQNAELSLCCSISVDIVIRWLLYDLYVLNHWYFMLANFCALCEWDHQAPELQHELLMSSVSTPPLVEFSSCSFMCTSYCYPQWKRYQLTMPSIRYIIYKWKEQEPEISGEFLYIQLTLEQHGFQLYRSTDAHIFFSSKYYSATQSMVGWACGCGTSDPEGQP